MAKSELYVNGIDVKYKKINKDDYISLTDLARYANPSEPKVPIATWMRNKDVISYLGLWEKLHNPDFKGHEFEAFENAAGKSAFKNTRKPYICVRSAGVALGTCKGLPLRDIETKPRRPLRKGEIQEKQRKSLDLRRTKRTIKAA